VDVGCHVGSFLSLLIKICPDGHHTAIEAVPKKAVWLKSKFKNVTIFSVAVGEKPGTAMFEENIEQPGRSRLQDLRPQDGAVQLYNVDIKRLDDILSEKVDFIKMDIEGAELAALRGARNIIERWKPSILFECGGEYDMALSGFDRQALYDFITKDLQYDIFSFVDFIFDKGKMGADEFRKCGIYPFRAFNFVALPQS
jgi:FkbM family methyltransferase